MVKTIATTLVSTAAWAGLFAAAVSAQGPTMPGPMPTLAEPIPAGALPSESLSRESIPTVESEYHPGQVAAPESLHTEHRTLSEALLPTPAPHELGDFAAGCEPGCQPDIYTESTGTWLRRGFWYTSIEGVVLSRKWERDDINLANATGALNVPVRPLTLDRSGPGAEGNARFTLGRFLFRDCSNRDHNAEFVAYGGGEWSQECSATIAGLNAAGLTGLQVPGNIDFNNQSFDNADTMAVSYASRFSTFEWNYRVSERMRRDRMEMQPSGCWVRRANNGWGKEWLAGLRYFDLEENLNWTATNIGTATSNADGAYVIRTRNNLFGLQLGYGLDYMADRWSVSLFSKHGVYVNDARGTYNFTRQDNATLNFANSGHDNTMSYLMQSGITGRYYIRPNCALRAGWEMLYVSSVALAPHQINFNPAYNKISDSGDNFYQGVSFGVDYFW